jgi:hypothetical protein
MRGGKAMVIKVALAVVVAATISGCGGTIYKIADIDVDSAAALTTALGTTLCQLKDAKQPPSGELAYDYVKRIQVYVKGQDVRPISQQEFNAGDSDKNGTLSDNEFVALAKAIGVIVFKYPDCSP